MKHKIKQAVALVCAVVMVVTSCFVEGMITSKASNTVENTVIKYNNPAIAVNVGDTINLSDYDVEFAEGVTTSDLTWYGNGKEYKVPYASPAIPATAGEALNLSEYKVQFTEGGEYLAVDTWEGVETDNNVFTPEKGVYQLTATAEGQAPKNVYVVAEEQDPEEYVLYFNSFDGEEYQNYTTDSPIVSYKDFINIEDSLENPNYYLTQIRTKKAETHYDIEDGNLKITRQNNGTTSGYQIIAAHLLLPTWLGEFGDYKVEMKAYTESGKYFSAQDYWMGIDLRAQNTQNEPEGQGPTTANNKGGYLHNNYIAYLGNRSLDHSQTVGMNYCTQPNYAYSSLAGGAYMDNKGATNITITDSNNPVILTATMEGDELSVYATQNSQKTDVATTSVAREYRTGRIGIFAYHLFPTIDYIKVALVVDELEYAEVQGEIYTYTPTEKGITSLTVSNSKGESKTIYVLAKEADDTEWVLYENDFLSETDANSIVQYFGSENGITTTAAVQDGKLNVDVKGTVYYQINEPMLKEFGNYRIEMTETTSSTSGINDSNTEERFGLFARGQEANQSYQNYTVKFKYKYYDSDGVSFTENVWEQEEKKLTQNSIVWGKYSASYGKVNEALTHSMTVQDKLVEYKITNHSADKTSTVLYDVQNRDLSKGYVGFMFQRGSTTDYDYQVSIDKIRVVFCPDETVPNAPTKATFKRTTSIAGMADGILNVQLSPDGSAAKDIVCYWADAQGKPLEEYTHFSKTLVEKGATTVQVELGKKIMVPEGAASILVYTENFMGQSTQCVKVELPDTLHPLVLGEEKSSFQVISDTHIIDKANHYTESNLRSFLSNIKANDADSAGIFIGGDLVETGSAAEYTAFNTIWSAVSESVEGLPDMHAVIGNHEFWTEKTYDATMTNFNTFTGNPANYFYNEVGGYGYIYLATSQLQNEDNHKSHTNAILGNEQIEFLKTTLKEKATDGKPIFIMLHQPLDDTVSGSLAKDKGGVQESEQVRAILANYPQAILFTSHSHVDLDQPDTMLVANDEGCNMFNTAAVSYLMNKHYTSAYITHDGAQGYYVEVYEDKVLVRGKDLLTNKWMPSAQFVVFMEEQEDEVFLEDSFDFTDTESVGYLADAFDTYQYNKTVNRTSTYAIEDNKTITDYFEMSDGLQAKSVPEDGYTVLTYNQIDLKNFEAEYTITNAGDYPIGLLFGGQPGVFPISVDGNNANDTGVALYMTKDGAMYVYGAVDPSSAMSASSGPDDNLYPSKVDETGATDIDMKYLTDGSYVYAPNMAEAATTYTICVKVSNGRLSVYEKNKIANTLTIDLSDSYKSGYVSLYTTNSTDGLFEKFSVKELKAWDYDMSVAFGGPRTGYLDEAFLVYQFDNKGEQQLDGAATPSKGDPNSYKKGTDKYFTASTQKRLGDQLSSGALKPASVYTDYANKNVDITTLTYTKHQVKDFKAEYDFYPSSGKLGLVFGGAKGVLPFTQDNQDNETGVAIYMTEDGKLYVYGAINTDTINTVEGLTVEKNSNNENVSGVPNLVITGIATAETTEPDTITKSTPCYTLCVKVIGNQLTIYEKSNEDKKVTITLASTYKGGYVSLMADRSQDGGFGGFRIQRLENYTFEGMDITEVNKYFDSYRFKTNSEFSSTNKPSEQWEIKDDKVKPTAGSTISLLTLKNKSASDFEATTTFTYYKDHGIMVAPTKEIIIPATESYKTVKGVLVRVDSNNHCLGVYGAVDAPSGTWTGNGGIKGTTNGYVRTENIGLTAGQQYVLHVKVEKGILTASIDGIEGTLTVKLSGNYVGGDVSLYAAASATGFSDFRFKSLEHAKAIACAKYSMAISPTNGGAKVSISTDVVESKLQGVLTYNSDVFTLDESNIEYVNESTKKLNDATGTTFTPNDGEIPINMRASSVGKVVTLFFNGNGLDFSGFKIENPNITTVGGRDVARVDNNVTVPYDYKEDQKLDAKDLVRGKLNQAEGKPAAMKSLRCVLVGEPTNFITEDVTFTENDLVLGSSGQPTVYSDCKITFPASSSLVRVNVLGPVTLDGVEVVIPASTSNLRIYANGHDFIINENVTFNDDGAIRILYGGSESKGVTSTHLELYAGNVNTIYGGSNSGDVTKSTQIIVGGSYNSNIDPWNHDSDTSKRIHAGCYNGIVYGDTNVTVTGNAKANRVYGGGYSGKAEVKGTCYVNINGGEAMGYYGGNRSSETGTVYHTVVTMTAGTTQQIFGGSEFQGMPVEGSSTSVTVTGGTVLRRIYGGCYNKTENLSYATDYHVTGNTTVTIGGNVEFVEGYEPEYAICATSRHYTAFSDEVATLNISKALSTKYSKYIGKNNQALFYMHNGYDTKNEID